eukprot:GHVU01187462.1.p4 GENE.GHVU01187462.1~~GHVU01187462.1.p4  ORF type:complete len:109 (-),score=13.24 GHVU01187462.1:103-429(-)
MFLVADEANVCAPEVRGGAVLDGSLEEANDGLEGRHTGLGQQLHLILNPFLPKLLTHCVLVRAYTQWSSAAPTSPAPALSPSHAGCRQDSSSAGWMHSSLAAAAAVHR